ncbi:response regulator receiver domain protein (CheY-like) [Flavobacteriaceae bacterium 3519-10]|nr:response regulator receiver domain protein (CheY-like) [Flavobacteriaceae bacterium 3519-10]
MIKELITDITYDKIKLSQGLTRAKLIANEIKNDIFSKWLNKELEGYEYQDEYLPSYRKIWSLIELVMEIPGGRFHTFPVVVPEDMDDKFKESVNNHFIIEPISIVEAQIESIDTSKGYITLPPQMIEILAKPFKPQITLYRGVIRKAQREIGKVHYQSVIELTKQKLIDTLMQLNNEFPNLQNKYEMTEENKNKVQHIITNNIYGNSNPLNIATGNNNVQAVNITSLKSEDVEKLKSYGVTEAEIEELKTIIDTKTRDKPKFVEKTMKWLGGVTASVAGRGLYENIPAITDFIHKLTL